MDEWMEGTDGREQRMSKRMVSDTAKQVFPFFCKSFLVYDSDLEELQVKMT